MFHQQGLHQQYTVPSVDEFVDLDNFLDNYLTQLHTDHQQGRQQGTAQQHGQATAGTGSAPVVSTLPNQQQVPGGLSSQPMGMLGVPGMQQMAGGAQSGMPNFDPSQLPGQVPLLGQVPGIPGLSGLGGMGGLQGIGGLPGLPGSAFGTQPGMQAFSASALTNSMAAGLPNNMAGLGLPGLGMHPMQPQQMGMAGPLQQPGLATSPTAPGGRGAGASTAAQPAKASRGRGGRGSSARSASRKSEPEHHTSEDEHNDSSDEHSSDGGEHKSRKKQMTADEAERRHLALQEKNRRAQRRFRERQKTKLQDLHKQIDELTHRVSLLQNENAALHSRTSILEKVLDMRNEQIQVMQETKEGGGYPNSEEELLQIQDVGGQLVQLTPEMIKELSSDQIYKIYQLYVKELSSQLTNSGSPGADGSPSAGEGDVFSSPQIDKLVKDLSMMIMRLGVIKPLETRKFIVVSRQYLGNNETEVIQLWKNVMKAIDLNEAQKREVVELKRMFLHKIEPIMDERKQLNVQIQANLPHDTFHTKNALTYIKAHEAVIKLRDNLRAEQHVVLEFAIAVFRGVFKPKQMATLLVKCYPAVPDALGIASALAAELGEPDTQVNQQLSMQLGGYLESGGNTVPPIPSTYMTLQLQAGASAMLPANSGGTPHAVPGKDTSNASGSGANGDQFAWMGRGGIPGPNTLLAIADQGPSALAQANSSSPQALAAPSQSQSGLPL